MCPDCYLVSLLSIHIKRNLKVYERYELRQYLSQQHPAESAAAAVSTQSLLFWRCRHTSHGIKDTLSFELRQCHSFDSPSSMRPCGCSEWTATITNSLPALSF